MSTPTDGHISPPETQPPTKKRRTENCCVNATSPVGEGRFQAIVISPHESAVFLPRPSAENPLPTAVPRTQRRYNTAPDSLVRHPEATPHLDRRGIPSKEIGLPYGVLEWELTPPISPLQGLAPPDSPRIRSERKAAGSTPPHGYPPVKLTPSSGFFHQAPAFSSADPVRRAAPNDRAAPSRPPVSVSQSSRADFKHEGPNSTGVQRRPLPYQVRFLSNLISLPLSDQLLFTDKSRSLKPPGGAEHKYHNNNRSSRRIQHSHYPRSICP